MISLDIVRKIKTSTVAIGLREKGKIKPHHLVGTGFIVDKTGVVITAKHVKDDCNTAQEFYLRMDKIDTERAMFRPIHSSTNLDFDSAPFKEFRHFNMVNQDPKFPITDVDLAFGIIEKMPSDVTELYIKKPKDNQYQVLENIATCGFPSGKYTLDVSGEISGMRFSPAFQPGIISSLLPFDDAPKPYGIQTNIVGTGGSSGSPIVNPQGEVLGIAQAVIPASLHEDATTIYEDTKYQLLSDNNLLREIPTRKKSRIFGHASVGLIYGITNHILYDLVQNAIKFHKGQSVGDIHLTVTGIDFKYNLEF